MAKKAESGGSPPQGLLERSVKHNVIVIVYETASGTQKMEFPAGTKFTVGFVGDDTPFLRDGAGTAFFRLDRVIAFAGPMTLFKVNR
jgi:hypothetical protein